MGWSSRTSQLFCLGHKKKGTDRCTAPHGARSPGRSPRSESAEESCRDPVLTCYIIAYLHVDIYIYSINIDIYVYVKYY